MNNAKVLRKQARMKRIPENEKTTKFVKGTILLRQGEKAANAYKVKKGCLKSYVLDKSGKEHILQFAPEDWIIADINSLLNNLPSSIYIEAIEDTEVELMGKNHLTQLDKMPAELIIQENRKFIRSLISINKRLIALLSSSATERYNEFIKMYPSLANRLPLKLIASYLGITPEYLSDIRRKNIRK